MGTPEISEKEVLVPKPKGVSKPVVSPRATAVLRYGSNQAELGVQAAGTIDPVRFYGPVGEVIAGPAPSDKLPRVVLGPMGEIRWAPERNVFPDFTPVTPALRDVAIKEAARLSQQLGIPIRADRMLEAPWIGRVYNQKGEYTSQSSSAGWERNDSRFWTEYQRRFTDDFKLLNADGTISVEFAKKMGWPTEGPNSVVGDKMEHHHVGNGTLVAPVPTKLHEKESAKIHAKVTIEPVSSPKILISGSKMSAQSTATPNKSIQQPIKLLSQQAKKAGGIQSGPPFADSKVGKSIEMPAMTEPVPATISGPPKKPALAPSSTPSPKATSIKEAPVLVGSPDEGYHLEAQPSSPEKPLPTVPKSTKNPPQPASHHPPTPSTKALRKIATPASIEKTAPKVLSTPIVPTKVVKPPQAPKAVLTASAKESAPTNPSVLKPEPPRHPSTALHPAKLSSIPNAKPPAPSTPPPSATLFEGPNNTFNPWSDRRLQKWNEGAIRKTNEYVKSRQNRSSAKEAGAALLGEMLGNALGNLNEWGIRNRTEEELAKLKPTLKAYQEAHPNDGVLIAIQIETWDPTWRPSDARPTRSFVSVVPQFGGKTKDEAMDRWSSEPKLLPGPSEGSRMGMDFIWIPPGQYVSLSKTNFINGRYVSSSDPTRMLIFQFEDNGTFHCDAVDPRSGERLRVEVVRGWQLNLNENSLKMTAKFYDIGSKAVIESEFMVLDSEWIQEHWSSDTGRRGDLFWQKSQF